MGGGVGEEGFCVCAEGRRGGVEGRWGGGWDGMDGGGDVMGE